MQVKIELHVCYGFSLSSAILILNADETSRTRVLTPLLTPNFFRFFLLSSDHTALPRHLLDGRRPVVHTPGATARYHERLPTNLVRPDEPRRYHAGAAVPERRLHPYHACA